MVVGDGAVVNLSGLRTGVETSDHNTTDETIKLYVRFWCINETIWYSRDKWTFSEIW